MSKQTKYYQHTLCGRPAVFDGDQICYITSWGRCKFTICKNLNQIKSEQKRTRIFRESEFGEHWDDIKEDYGYIIIHIPED